jgi:hypothetical protein
MIVRLRSASASASCFRSAEAAALLRGSSLCSDSRRVYRLFEMWKTSGCIPTKKPVRNVATVQGGKKRRRGRARERSGVASTPPSWFFPSRMVARLTLLLALCSMLQATVALTVAPMRVCAATRGSVAMAEGMRSGDSVKVISGASKVCAIEAQSMWPRPRSPSPMPTAPPPRNVVSPGYGCEAAHA